MKHTLQQIPKVHLYNQILAAISLYCVRKNFSSPNLTSISRRVVLNDLFCSLISFDSVKTCFVSDAKPLFTDALAIVWFCIVLNTFASFSLRFLFFSSLNLIFCPNYLHYFLEMFIYYFNFYFYRWRSNQIFLVSYTCSIFIFQWFFYYSDVEISVI